MGVCNSVVMFWISAYFLELFHDTIEHFLPVYIALFEWLGEFSKIVFA